jgi:hypothetical protein
MATAQQLRSQAKIWRDLASGEAPSLASAMVSKAEALEVKADRLDAARSTYVARTTRSDAKS